MGGSSFSDVQNIVDHHHHQSVAKPGSRVRFNEVAEEIKDIELIDVADDDHSEENSSIWMTVMLVVKEIPMKVLISC
ncbi:hypothetical protein CEXT_576591 [Caerostris extrusa]|uniref:Uncharacterized protein n=1 Tax=Caerostris extrusa TaxID=172846 RepID=A0AAV4WNC3_CAEEX|nr:hypothetical protein CEXT_576591 [Caerostris extrusa]